MAGTVRYVKVESRTARMKLKPGKAYWRNLILGRFSLGYQRKVSGAPGRWIARTTLGNDRWRITPLGLADDYAEADGVSVLSFADASAAALKSYRTVDGGTAPTSILTVADAIADYCAWLKVHRATGPDAEARAKKLILPELGRLRLADLTSARLNQWRDDMAAAPALARTSLGAKQKYRKAPATEDAERGRRASANRVLSTLKAALNRAFEAGHIEDDTAWRRVKPFEKVNAARPGHLSVAEAQRLINGCDGDFRRVVQGALLTGCRWGELRALRVADYARGKVHIAKSKSGKPRDVILSEEGSTFFDALTVGRPANEPMFIRDDGAPWESHAQVRPMQAACARANIKPAVGFHQLRHSWASLAVMAGMPLIVVARNLGHASTIMVERHYGHLTESFVDKEVRDKSPSFGIAPPAANVTPIRGQR